MNVVCLSTGDARREKGRRSSYGPVSCPRTERSSSMANQLGGRGGGGGGHETAIDP